ncbi:EPIDERMAL PATTERNING FACTOR-like protein 1 [Ancistrocladus abbreviatus]
MLRIMGLEEQGLLFEEKKTRLGSTPPSCHNKCNQCHPCMAVQVPTLTSHDRVQPSLTRKFLPTTGFYDLASGSNNRYSNYKPLGWKCHCNGHFYNP